MKKVLLLMALFLGTTVMVNAETISAKPNKEVKIIKHPRHKKQRAEKKAEMAKMEASKAK